MQTVPLQALASQSVSVLLAGQACVIDVYQKSTGLFMNLYLSGTLCNGGVICQDLNRIVRDAYFGFLGDFVFVDTQGSADPDYTGLGARFQLLYITTADLADLGLTG